MLEMTNFWKVHMRYVEEDNRIYDDYNASNNLITIYWNRVGNLNEFTLIENEEEVENKLNELLKIQYPNENEETRRNWQTSLKYFVWEMEIGDFVLSPTKDEKVFLGIIQSGYFYYKENHHRKVEWTILSRKIIPEKLNLSLGTPRTVTSLNKYNEDISSLYLEYCLT